MLQTKELLKLKPNASNLTANIMTTVAANMMTTVVDNMTPTTKTITTVLPNIMNSTTLKLMTTLAMMTAIPTTTKLPFPVGMKPNCNWELTPCTFSLSDVQSVSNASHLPITDVPGSIAPHVTTIANNWSSTATAGFGPTVSFSPDRRGGSGRTENTTEAVFNKVEHVQISADAIYDYSETSSSEDTTDTANVSYTHSYDVTSDRPTIGPTIDPVTSESTLTSPTDVSADDVRSIATESMWSPMQSTNGEMVPEVFAGTKIIADTEPTASLDADGLTTNYMIDRSIVITTTDYDDESYDTTTTSKDPKMLNMAEMIDSPESKRIVKRTAELIINGSNCYHLVCSSSSPAPRVTEAPNGFQGFTEKSSKGQSV